jgi:hypothetical protein
MFNDLFHPYLRWLRGRSQGNTPDFNIDRHGLPSQNLVQPPVNFPIPEADVLLQSAPPTGLANFVAEQVPGFRLGLRDAVPGFNLNENDLQHSETTWPDRLETPPPGSSDTAQTLALPPGVEEPDQPTRQLPEWLRNVLTLPVPGLSTALDPQTGQRIVPYGPLINWTKPYLTAGQHETRSPESPGAYVTGINAVPDQPSVEPPSIQQWPKELAHLNPDYGSATQQSANARPLVPEARWPDSSADDQVHMQTSGVSPRDLAGFGLVTRTGDTAIEHSVYNPGVDPRYDELFERVGIKENKAQGDAAKEAEGARIKRANPEAGVSYEKRVYAAGVYMVADIILRPNGTTAIYITEVKSGDGKLSPRQAEILGEALRTGKISIVSKDAAEHLKVKPYKTFASQGIIPQVSVVGGNQDAIARQLKHQGVEVVPQKVRKGQPSRLRGGGRPT